MTRHWFNKMNLNLTLYWTNIFASLVCQCMLVMKSNGMHGPIDEGQSLKCAWTEMYVREPENRFMRIFNVLHPFGFYKNEI